MSLPLDYARCRGVRFWADCQNCKRFATPTGRNTTRLLWIDPPSSLPCDQQIPYSR